MNKKAIVDEEEKYAPAEEQGITPDETEEEKEFEMQTGEKDEDIYEEKGREQQIENDEISDSEEGYMEGAAGTGSKSKCDKCGRILQEDKDEIIETKKAGKLVWLCINCAEE